MNPITHMNRFLSVAVVAFVLAAVCLSAVAEVPRPAPTGSVAAPSARLVDINAAPPVVRNGQAASTRLAGSSGGAARAATATCTAAIASRPVGEVRVSLEVRSFPLRT